jgi:methionyl-tRNA formyltransferase
MITKADGRIDWHKPAIRLEREVRAYNGWPRSQARLGTTEVIITSAHTEKASGQPGTLKTQDRQLGIYCGQGMLVIDSLVPAGKQEMSAAAFLAGYRLT